MDEQLQERCRLLLENRDHMKKAVLPGRAG